MDWIHLAQERDKWRAVNTVMGENGNLLTEELLDSQ
jgi:hypothetical protein